MLLATATCIIEQYTQIENEATAITHSYIDILKLNCTYHHVFMEARAFNNAL